MTQERGAGRNESELAQAGEWVCNVCGYVYSEGQGCPADGIGPGTPWDQVPSDWLCPDCGVGKGDFTQMD